SWPALVLVCSIGSANDSLEFFEKQVRPVLVKNCVSCHGPSQQSSSLRVDSRDSLLKGGNRGPALIPGDARLSLIARAVRHEDLKMPIGIRLKDEEIAAIEKWVNAGAPWPKDPQAAQGPGAPGYYEKIRKEHWAFQAVREPKLPSTKNTSWSDHPVDRFILASLEAANLRPAAPADSAALIRRLALVLTGLPPTPLEVDLFVNDRAPGAYERLVDRLLASPHFGEHWARHWMDLMRFAETFGNDWNYEINGAWQYRDYLIRAFNQDVPYNQLVREHLAGDLLQKPRINLGEAVNESAIGTSSLRLGELGHDDCIRFRQIRTDVVDNAIDTLGKAFQGLTIACARCHDHKLDPIPTADYYGLYGVLTSSRMVMQTADLPDANAAVKQQLREWKPRVRGELASLWLREADRIPRYLMAAHRAWKGAAPKPADLTELSLERVQAWLSQLDQQKPVMEDPVNPWIEFAKTSDWKGVSSAYAKETKARAVYNSERFRPFGNLSAWHGDGNALSEGASQSGEFAVANGGALAISGIFPAGIYTHSLSERLNAGLRSPLVPKDKKFVSMEVMGGQMGARRTILDNCMLSEDYQLLESDLPSWIKVPNRDDQPGLPFYLELVTKQNNPRIPDRPGRLKVTPEQLASPYSYFGITRAVLHDVNETPKAELGFLQPLFAGSAPSGLEELAELYAGATRRALTAWASGKATDDEARWLGWLIAGKLLTNSKDMSPALATLIADYRAAESRIGAAKTFQGMADLDAGYDFPVLIGGDAAQPGKLTPRGFLSLVTPSPETFRPTGSGRLEVAELLASPTNPLTSRVMANRIWQHVFGRGIVPTADNFGTYGERPSHPELLDYLATRFVREGWSIKKQIRFLVMSQTFRQSSLRSKEGAQIDPLNSLLSHYPIRRMEGESIRDAILTVSGRLEPALYGPSIQPYREEPKDYRKLYQGPLDGDGRRSMYIKVTRHEGSRFLETFDFPNPNVARGNRDTTNVPPQALALLNDPFVIAQSGVWADKLIAQQTPSAETRIEAMFRTALGRLPNEAERDRFTGLTKELASLHKVPPDKMLTSRELWKDLAHAIFNLKEFIYIR
ncbi:MAG: PSD1 and planctomycete cytochrome C domain-containing protein, partial [Bryobacteraceae bacterium]